MEQALNSLLPRRREVYETIKDHPYITFDSLVRRFAGTPARTLSYDVHELIRFGFVQKHGVTKGVCYSVSV